MFDVLLLVDCVLCSLVSFRVPLISLQTVVGGVVRTLNVMYGSLGRSVDGLQSWS